MERLIMRIVNRNPKAMHNPIFCVWCPPYLEWSGGSIALHRLVHVLADKGYEAYAVGCHKSDLLKGGLITEDKIQSFIQYNNDRVVIIYPEVVEGNPYGAKNVFRWLLNDPAATIGKSPSFEGEHLFTYCDYYKGIYTNRVIAELSTFDLRLDTYADKGQHIKGKTCYTIRKGYNKTHDKHPSDAILIRDYQQQQTGEELIKIFDECETFISYDTNTFLSVHAALRGCISIVIPNEGVSKEQWRGNAIYLKYGVAYGFDDIEYAIETRHLMKDYLREYEIKSDLQVDAFIDYCRSVLTPTFPR